MSDYVKINEGVGPAIAVRSISSAPDSTTRAVQMVDPITRQADFTAAVSFTGAHNSSGIDLITTIKSNAISTKECSTLVLSMYVQSAASFTSASITPILFNDNVVEGQVTWIGQMDAVSFVKPAMLLTDSSGGCFIPIKFIDIPAVSSIGFHVSEYTGSTTCSLSAGVV